MATIRVRPLLAFAHDRMPVIVPDPTSDPWRTRAVVVIGAARDRIAAADRRPAFGMPSRMRDPVRFADLRDLPGPPYPRPAPP